MATRDWDAGLAADLEAARHRDTRAAMMLIGAIGLIEAASVANGVTGALDGDVVPMGRVSLGILGIVAGLALRRRQGIAW